MQYLSISKFSFANALSLGSIAWLTGLAYFLVKGYQARAVYAKFRKDGLPMPPWNPFLGHLLVLPGILKKLPKDAQQPDAFGILSRDFRKSDQLFYLDLWPFSNPFLIVSSPQFAIQACQENDLPKPGILKPFFAPLAGGDNLFTMNGSQWKRSRGLFNPGFNSRYILEQTSHIIQEAEVYLQKLREHAKKGDIFSLDEVTLWYTMDIIGAVTLNSRFNSQRKYNRLASAMRSQIDWHCLDDELNPFIRWNPFRTLVQWYNSYLMNSYISAELDKRYAEWASDNDMASSSRSIINLVLTDRMKEVESKNAQTGKKSTSAALDPAFKAWATVQIRLFLFAGHDSTSSSICYCYYLLSKNPSVMEKIRAEHDEVLGTDLTAVPDLLRQTPDLLNQLPYTNAVIKEAMRLFPPASGLRSGLPGVFLQDTNTGKTYPTEGVNIWILHNALQRNPRYWPDPDTFLPERWLVEPNHPLHPVKGAWRPFEHGPRNCLGQTLAMLDIRITLALTLREFDIRDAYDEWDRLNPTSNIKHVNGERAYQISAGGAHPADGFPCRVSLRGHKKG